MKPTKKEIEEAKKQAKKIEKKSEVKMTHIDELWDVIKEMQENLDHLNGKVKTISSRMGL